MDYIQRYMNGECVQVWSELLDHGEAVRQEPLYSAAYAVWSAICGRVWPGAASRALHLLTSTLCVIAHT